MSLTLEARLQTDPDVIVTQLQDSEGRPESVLLHLATHKYFSLNSTGVNVWSALERGMTLSAAAAELTQVFDVTPDQAEASVLRLAHELVDERLAALPREPA